MRLKLFEKRLSFTWSLDTIDLREQPQVQSKFYVS